MRKIVIIGNGISGITTARTIRKLCSDQIMVISDESQYFFSRTALMYVYMGHMKPEHIQPYENWFWKKNHIELVNDRVVSVDSRNSTLLLNKQGILNYDVLVIASGSKPNKFGWPGEDLKGVTGMYSWPDLKIIEQYTKDIKHGVIVGGGLIGIELAEMLHSRNIPITFLVREDSFWNNVLPAEESAMINKLIREHHIDLLLDTELKEVLPDNGGRVKSIVTSKGQLIDCEFVGLTAGVSPNINFLKGSGIETQRGVLVNEYLETNIKNVYALGDCAQHKIPPAERKPIEQVWYTGRLMGEALAQTIAGTKIKYEPGIWFNSAKFFDVEYQTYGWVWAQTKENEEAFYWEDSDSKRCIRLVYNCVSKDILGINVFGIRLRQDVCEEWIRNKTHVHQVLENLPAANFDPEFFKSFEKQILEKFNQQNNTTLSLKTNRGLFSKFFSLRKAI